jgi:hypothetical protein
LEIADYRNFIESHRRVDDDSGLAHYVFLLNSRESGQFLAIVEDRI